ncbi:hypothetical protein HK100_003305 [Physocladia obscura]|uniref:Uncharacterized protein n=1 Tax=Physocladia obscura TaxID=109957 RepID=A0AAD5SUD0_9FUNG|nr:hypothetical protein HK100_003305 [Physocladia obscura]
MSFWQQSVDRLKAAFGLEQTKLPATKLAVICAATLVAGSLVMLAVRQSFREYGRGFIRGSEAFKRAKGRTGKGIGWKNPKKSGKRGRGGSIGGNMFRGTRPQTSGFGGVKSLARRF